MKRSRHYELGQNVIEYILVFILVVGVLLVFLRPRGVLVQNVNKSLNQAVKFVGKELGDKNP
ncbi:MAG: hypothetical protein HQL25_01035 [Candidatus Omnitrophica bacterium]|nr:hypothetical protein [Candidatus Omnitrophota bacterium]